MSWRGLYGNKGDDFVVDSWGDFLCRSRRAAVAYVRCFGLYEARRRLEMRLVDYY
jgi:hypothetical protein